ncbi:MAG TPA: serine--tRNA ligase, partial [Devosia sp.]|nr:serine--tRNA ligase [Devosia sp.]
MYDMKWLRENAEQFDTSMRRRGLGNLSGELLEMDDARRAAVAHMNELQEKRNTASRQIGKAKGQGNEEEAARLLAEVGNLKAEIQRSEEKVRELSEALHERLLVLPNLLKDDVPDGADENDNVEISRFLEPTGFDFKPREHYELGEALGLMDFEAAARMSGSRFVVLRGELSRLERALAAFMLDLH